MPVEDSVSDSLPAVVATAESISKKLYAIEKGVRPVAFSHVTEAAQAFLGIDKPSRLKKASELD